MEPKRAKPVFFQSQNSFAADISGALKRPTQSFVFFLCLRTEGAGGIIFRAYYRSSECFWKDMHGKRDFLLFGIDNSSGL